MRISDSGNIDHQVTCRNVWGSRMNIKVQKIALRCNLADLRDALFSLEMNSALSSLLLLLFSSAAIAQVNFTDVSVMPLIPAESDLPKWRSPVHQLAANRGPRSRGEQC
jgi:hypothetical protein